MSLIVIFNENDELEYPNKSYLLLSSSHNQRHHDSLNITGIQNRKTPFLWFRKDFRNHGAKN